MGYWVTSKSYPHTAAFHYYSIHTRLKFKHSQHGFNLASTRTHWWHFADPWPKVDSPINTWIYMWGWTVADHCSPPSAVCQPTYRVYINLITELCSLVPCESCVKGRSLVCFTLAPSLRYHALLVQKVSVRDLKTRSFSKLLFITASSLSPSSLFTCLWALLCIPPPFLSYLLSLVYRLYTVVSDTYPVQCIVEFECLAVEE